jgi:putative metalloprotease
MMLLMLVAGIFTVQAQLKIGGKSIDTRKLGKAAEEVAKAVTLSDADVVALCREAIEWMDENNPIADETTEYGARLARLTQNIKEVNGLPLNFKVYHVIDINAFACGDGSIRVFSSLMDLMDDDELMAIIGHEIGHIAGTDVKDAIKNAYLTSAAINAAGAASKTVSKLSNTQLRELTESFVGARFSQKQEYAADEYGYKTCVENGFSPYGMANALNKLVELSQGAKASAVQQMFSSHPDSEKRAQRMKEKADAATK